MVGGFEPVDEGAGVGAGWLERGGDPLAAEGTVVETLGEGVKTERATAVEVTSRTSSESCPSSVECLREPAPGEEEDEGGDDERERDAGGRQGRISARFYMLRRVSLVPRRLVSPADLSRHRPLTMEECA